MIAGAVVVWLVLLGAGVLIVWAALDHTGRVRYRARRRAARWLSSDGGVALLAGLALGIVGAVILWIGASR